MPALYWLVVNSSAWRAACTTSSCRRASSSKIRSAARLSSTSWKAVSTVWRYVAASSSYTAIACCFCASRSPPSNTAWASAPPSDQKRLGVENRLGERLDGAGGGGHCALDRCRGGGGVARRKMVERGRGGAEKPRRSEGGGPRLPFRLARLDRPAHAPPHVELPAAVERDVVIVDCADRERRLVGQRWRLAPRGRRIR